MQRSHGRLVLSPTDLTKHVACPHVTTLDLLAVDDASIRASTPDDALNLIFAKGLTHEHGYLEQLRAEGRRIVEIDTSTRDREAEERATVAAMREGVDVVYQATLYDGRWVGYADFLLRTERPSDLGDWSYDIADTKLARRLKVPALLQMATYAERLAVLQGVPPQYLVVVTGDKQQHPWRLVDVAPYARLRRAALQRAIDDGLPTEAVPCAYCAQCRWHDHCAAQWTATDDLSLVAGMRADHRVALRANGISTLAQLAAAAPETVSSLLSGPVARRLHQQARLQLQERESGEPGYELLSPEPGRGLQRLPAPSHGDVYLDFEGDPWADDGTGREYLAGLWDRGKTFTALWAHDSAQEKRLTEDLVDELGRRWRADPDMHVYHYAPYERTALQRLTARHGTREAELDQLLRAERLVDLYAVVRQGVRISKPSYSIKKLEDFYWGRARAGADGEVADAMTSVVEYERYLVERDPTILAAIAAYNQDDVESTHDLHEWLEQRRDELEQAGHVLERLQPGQTKEVSDDELAETALAERLVEAGHELLAGCVGWHRREARPGWWDFFRYGDLDTVELVEDATAIGALAGPVHVGDVTSKTGRVTSKIWRYAFPPQDVKVKHKDYLCDVDSHATVGKVVDCDAVQGWIDLSVGASRTPTHPRGLKPSGPIADRILRESIASTGDETLSGRGGAAARLLGGDVPPSAALAARDGETPAEQVVRVGLGLDGEVLAVQGPPGTGKTYAAALLIRALLDQGKRVGVTALSHAVIRNVLHEVDRPSIQKVSEPRDAVQTRAGTSGIATVTDNAAVEAALAAPGPLLVGGTAWLWARPELRDCVDVLVIDEAGQFSLANAVAVAPAARSLVLLGDPQQLTQPTQAVHPFGAGVSALQHLIGDHDTVPDDRGVFLGTTWRMHPSVADFVSDLAYEGRLDSAPGRELQRITGAGPLAGSGIRWLPVAHDGCTAASAAEADAVAGVVADLLTRSWVDHTGSSARMTPADVLVVAPFNAHVAGLRSVLPSDVRVGTVDTFQGQQAPVVVYSMASSSAALAPRGVSFLFDLHRLNVAVSRAKAMSIVVGSPRLLDAEVRSPEQLRAVNALCRYVEQAEGVTQRT
jgi:predicted RecB family nuclease